MSKQIQFDMSEQYIQHAFSVHRGQSAASSKGRRAQRSRQTASDPNVIEAMQYARAQMADPEARALYESHAFVKGRTARSLAMFDYLIAPTIKKIDATKYTGVVGETIRIRAVDDFMVITVGVLITDSKGEVIERGAAVPQISQDQWAYRITSWNECLRDCTIVASAHDVAGNITLQTLTLY
ncbi:hypothetical protein WBG78_07305 [Chryseolinea sp. T2]|uniref:hypothetical protein n=1 Tax=Chryseolinea sp. T2 TaxID=3129255 RepID=UPI003076C663